MKNWEEMSAVPPRDASASYPSTARKEARNFWKRADRRGEGDETLCHEETVK